jgi:hypothetical protein
MVEALCNTMDLLGCDRDRIAHGQRQSRALPAAGA